MERSEPKTLSQIKAELSPSAQLALTVIESLSPEEEALCQQYLNYKYPFRTKIGYEIMPKPSNPIPDAGLTCTEVAKMMSLNPVTVRDFAQEGRFSGAYKLGRDWRIPAASLPNFERKKRGRPRRKVV